MNSRDETLLGIMMVLIVVMGISGLMVICSILNAIWPSGPWHVLF